MNTFTTKKYLVLAAVSIILSLSIIRWHSQDSVPFCVNSAGCSARETLRGTVTVTTYGFPATYRQVEKFVPDNQNPASGGYPGYKQAQAELEGFSVPKLVANVVFWFALLHLLASFIKQKKRAAATQPAPTPTANSATRPTSAMPVDGPTLHVDNKT